MSLGPSPCSRKAAGEHGPLGVAKRHLAGALALTVGDSAKSGSSPHETNLPTADDSATLESAHVG